MTGIVLAGGKNSRIGTKKAFLKLGNKTIIESILDVLEKIFLEIIIVTNTPRDYESYGARLVGDLMPEKGSLGGIYSGLASSKSEYNFIMACDMPFPNEGLIRHMTSEYKGFEIVTPVIKGCCEPLFTLYSKSCSSIIRNRLEQDHLKITDFFSNVRVKELGEDIIKRFDPEMYSFFNVNTDEDYRRALQIEKAGII